MKYSSPYRFWAYSATGPIFSGSPVRLNLTQGWGICSKDRSTRGRRMETKCFSVMGLLLATNSPSARKTSKPRKGKRSIMSRAKSQAVFSSRGFSHTGAFFSKS